MVRIGKGYASNAEKDKFKSQRNQSIPVCEIETGRRDIKWSRGSDVKMIEMADGERGGSLGGR
jgi:hypothetical protein